MKTAKTITTVLVLVLCTSLKGAAQKEGGEGAILFGLNQPLFLQGFNVEVDYFTRKFSFDLSHGMSLEFKSSIVGKEMKDQHLVAHLPYSTGAGVGYRFTPWLALRVEPKWHRFEIYYDGAEQTSANRITAYNTFTLGLGLYGKWHPFKQQENFLRGILVAPSIRWWPNVSSTLPNDEYAYYNKITGQNEIHHAQSIGVSNTPWFVNVSVGYTIAWR